MARRGNIIKNLDWVTIILYLLLVFLGWLNIYAAVYNEEHHSIFSVSQRYGKQLIWIVAAIIIILVIFLFDSKFYSFFAYLFYGIMLLLLILVLLFGKEVHGSKSWFEIGSVAIQPAEFAKFSTSLALAKYLSSFNFSMKKFSHLFRAILILILPVGLIILQNDVGSALVYLSFIFVLYREGVSIAAIIIGVCIGVLFILSLIFSPGSITFVIVGLSLLSVVFIRNLKEFFAGAIILLAHLGILWLINEFFSLSFSFHQLIIAALIASVIALFYLAYRHKLRYIYLLFAISLTSIGFTYSVDYIFHNILERHQRTRINVLLGVEKDVRGAGYNVHQSLIAIGSGGFDGKGFLKGTQTKYDFVPEQSTDFIFCTVGEEWGFIGTSVVIVLFIILLLRLVFLAERQRSPFSRVYGYSVASILFFHLAVNIGMTIGLTPVIGIPLPFFSYGGSSLWAFTILLFIFVRLDASRLEIL